MTGQDWIEQATAGHADHRRETPASITESCRHCQAEREAFRRTGQQGGKAGTGEAKRRGDSAYYKALRERSYIFRQRFCDVCGADMGIMSLKAFDASGRDCGAHAETSED